MWSEIVKSAKCDRPCIATGPIRDNSGVEGILKQASEYVDMVILGRDVPGYKSEPNATVYDAVATLKDKQVDGLVSGDFSSKEIHAEIEKQFGVRLIRVGLIRREERSFFIGPMIASGGETVKDRLEVIEKTVQTLHQLDQEPKIGVISMQEGYLGTDHYIDSVIIEAKYLVHHFAPGGLSIKDYSFFIDQAILDDCNLIISPSGLALNWMVMALKLWGAEYIGGLGLLDHIYVHTSSSLREPAYLSSIILAAALANLQKKQVI